MRTCDKNKALVVLSGGQDSATCLSWTKHNFDEVYAVSFQYGQRHNIELECAVKLVELANVKRHFIINLEEIFKNGTVSALLDHTQTNDESICNEHELDPSIPSSFVPFRNMYFLTAAASVAYTNKIQNIVTGVCQTDFSGYADCRSLFIKSLNATLDLAVDSNFEIQTPLMYLDKKETVLLMKTLGTLDWYKHTHTCYNGKRPPCGVCPACRLRQKGFEEAGLTDPLMES